MTLAIRVQNLSKNYGKIKVLNNISFDVTEGDVLGLAGPNGSGKTTLLKILNHCITDYAGSLQIQDHDLNRANVGRITGYMPEMIDMFSDLNALDMMKYVGRLRGLNKRLADRRAGELLEWLGMKERAHDRIQYFSAGMKKKVLLAQSLINDPQILFLDEPTSNLDPSARRQLIMKIEGLKNQGKTMIISSHALPELDTICTSYCILSSGSVVSLEKVPQGFSHELHVSNPALVLAEMEQKGLNGALGEGNVVLVNWNETLNHLMGELILNNKLTVLELRKATAGIEKKYFEQVA